MIYLPIKILFSIVFEFKLLILLILLLKFQTFKVRLFLFTNLTLFTCLLIY
jgi:hypothetical protein